DLVGLVADVVLAHVDLELALAVRQRGERGLAHRPLEDDASGDPHRGRFLLEVLRGLRPVGLDDLGERVAALEAARVGVDAQGPQRAGLLEPLLRLLGPARDGSARLLVAHRPPAFGPRPRAGRASFSLSSRTRARIASRIPLTNGGVSASPKRFAIST